MVNWWKGRQKKRKRVAKEEERKAKEGGEKRGWRKRLKKEASFFCRLAWWRSFVMAKRDETLVFHLSANWLFWIRVQAAGSGGKRWEKNACDTALWSMVQHHHWWFTKEHRERSYGTLSLSLSLYRTLHQCMANFWARKIYNKNFIGKKWKEMASSGANVQLVRIACPLVQQLWSGISEFAAYEIISELM